MIEVQYRYTLNYRYDAYGKQTPIMPVRVMRPDRIELAVDLGAYLDSGAERSLLDGRIIVPALDIELMAGKRLIYGLTGHGFEARVHRVRLNHPALGSIDLEAGISTAPITRNILGRDFFDHVQIGFRERELKFFLTPNP